MYIAPPDRHLLIAANGQIHLGHGPRENRARPAVDPLFRSAALAYGTQVIGVILTGALDDGTAGLCAIKQAGGIAVVQDPHEAEAASMPRSALRHVAVDHCVQLDKMADLLTKLVHEPLIQTACERSAALQNETQISVQVARDETLRQNGIIDLGMASRFTCPECHGSLSEIQGNGPLRFRCHTGHAFTVASLEAELRDKIEASSWNTIRSLEEHAMLLEEMVTIYGDELDGHEIAAKAADARRRAKLVREALVEKES
jgi:two-component system chemotaxis response regulator CheB